MGLIYVPSRRISPYFAPDYPVKINWDHPLAQYLEAYILNGRDLVGERFGTPTGSVGKQATIYGAARSYPSASTYDSYSHLENQEVTGALTIAAIISTESGTTDANIGRKSTADNPNNPFALSFSSSRNGLYFVSAGSNYGAYKPAASAISAGETKMVGVRRPSTTQSVDRFWADRTAFGATKLFSGGNVTVTGSGAPITLGNNGTSSPVTVGLFAVFSKSLSDDEWSLWMDDHFSGLLVPVNGNIWVPVSAGGSQSISVTHTSETDSAQTITAIPGAVSVSLVNAAETDAAQAIGAYSAITVSVTPAAETGAAQTIAPALSVSIAISQAGESESAQAISAVQAGATSLSSATETDTAQTITPVPGALAILVGVATETDAAQTITASNGLTVALSPATETDTSQTISAIAGAVSIAVDAALETGTAQTITVYQPGSTTLTSADLDAIWDVELETGYTARQMMRIMFAALAGKRSGLGTSTESYYDVATGTTVRISLTPDANGNGTPVVDGT